MGSLALLRFGSGGWGWPLLEAALMTIAVAFSGFGLGLVAGVGVAALKLSANWLLRIIGEVYTTVVRGVPELLILYFLFFGGTAAISRIASVLSGEGFVGAPAFLTGMLALAVIAAAYSAEVIRGAWLAIDAGQGDAARALGLRPVLSFVLILFPQIMRLALPGLGNVWQLILKGSALISLAGLTEIMRQSVIAATAETRPFLFYGTAALIYLALSTVSSRVFQILERRSERWSAL